jgi:glycosyltransferase involved in cell wall biosynthesis
MADALLKKAGFVIRFSLIVPTRHRTAGLRRLLDSVSTTVRNPGGIEVVAVIDADDTESIAFSYSGIAYRQVIVPPGQTMGELNLAGYRQAAGRYLMLLNDDVVIRSKGWDTEIERVFAGWPDGIVLVHVNDLLFRDTLCIFPCVTPAFCELMGGICHPAYRRYRIDDHLHNIFDLIHLLGYTRRVFLPQVVFEHTSTTGHYTPDPATLEFDDRPFEELLPQRRKIALDCVERIEGRARPEDRATRALFLEGFPDSLALRRREYAVWWPRIVPPGVETPAVRASLGVRMAFRFWEMLAKLGIGLPPELFDSRWYLQRYPDVAAIGQQPLTHYFKTGAFHGYNPSPNFDSNWYLATNPDVAASGLNPLAHFVLFGAREKRSPKPLSDAAAISPPLLAEAPAPLSVLIPTHNRRTSLLRTLEACHRHRGGCELEFVVIDDGSPDETASLLGELASTVPGLRWQSQPAAGPARARNLAASLARYDVLLFLGDDIVPASDDFFRAHALRQAQHPDPNFAVLGKLDWPDVPDFPVNFTMRQIHADGSQFAYSRLIPGSFAGWQFFYSSNLSIKKSLVSDWLSGGFDTGFPGAAFEDIELAYRLFRSQAGLRLYYDPVSLGMHYHAYTVDTFIERQYRAGRSQRHLIDLHPELADEYDVRRIDRALRQPAKSSNGERGDRAAASIDALKEEACTLESRRLLGTAEWHGEFLSALFILCLEDGYASCCPAGNLAAARNLILDRLFSRLQRIPAIKPFHGSP